MRLAHGWRGAAGVVLAVLSGCSVSVHVGKGSSGGVSTPPSIVHDGQIALDFRQSPSRAAFGLDAEENFRGYEATYHRTYQLRITLPGGVLRLPAHYVDGATDGEGGAVDTDHSHLPKFFTIDVLYPSDAAADAALVQQYALLGIRGQDHPLGTFVYGSPSNRLSVEIERRSSLTASLQPNERLYEFSFDQYRNPAVDAVYAGGRMALDLRRRPSRAALGFLDGYTDANIESAPPSQVPVALALRTPHGSAVLVVESVISSSGLSSDPQPRRERAAPATTVMISVSSVTTPRAQLLQAAPAIGLDRAAVSALFAGPASAKRAVHATTSVYDLTVTVQADPSRTDNTAVSISYSFTYH